MRLPHKRWKRLSPNKKIDKEDQKEVSRIIKRVFALITVWAVLSFYGCKTEPEKKEELPKTGIKQKNSSTKPNKADRTDRAAQRKAGFAAADLQLYNEGNLVTSIQPEQFDSLATKKMKAGRQQYEVTAVLLGDLLTKNNLSGKTVVLSGPSQSVSVPWDEAVDGQIFICKGNESAFRVLDQKRKVRLPGALTKIEVTEKASESARTESAKEEGTY